MRRHFHYFTVFIFVVISTTSCAPIYTCNDDRPTKPIHGSNRLLAVVKERDELCDALKSTEKINGFLVKENDSLNLTVDSLGAHILNMNTAYADLEEKHEYLTTSYQELTKEQIDLLKEYSNLFTDNFTQAHLFNQQMKDKEDKLREKEQNLNARERRIKELEDEIARQDSIAKQLNKTLREALLRFKSDELNIEIKDGKVYVSMSDKLMFKSGSASLEKKGKEAVALIAKVIADNPNFEVLIEGHTDNVPISTNIFSDNWDLSVARATAMVRLLINEHNIPTSQVTASGKGEFSPKASNETAEGRATNRRTEIILSPKLNELIKLINE